MWMMIEAIRAGLAERADPVKAPEMQHYMKSDMPFRGVQKPERVKLAREVFVELPREEWERAVLTLWREATFREEWSVDADLWKRRASIIAQVRRKVETDFALMTDCIEPNRGDREFFIRKAIGWALRSYAWVAPDAVVAYCDTHELAPLSRREALKNIRA